MPFRWSFARKALAAAALVALADRLFYGEEPGWTLGIFALVWVAALLHPGPTRFPQASIVRQSRGVGWQSDRQ